MSEITSINSNSNRDSNTTVAHIFDSWSTAHQAVNALQAANFRDDQIGLLSLDQKTGQVQQSNVQAGQPVADEKAVGGGVATGAAVGGAAGLLTALAALVIPGVGPILAGGILASSLGATLAGAGIGATAGGMIGAFKSLGFSDEDAQHYEKGIRGGGTLVTVHDSGRNADASRILEQFGGRTR